MSNILNVCDARPGCPAPALSRAPPPQWPSRLAFLSPAGPLDMVPPGWVRGECGDGKAGRPVRGQARPRGGADAGRRRADRVRRALSGHQRQLLRHRLRLLRAGAEVQWRRGVLHHLGVLPRPPARGGRLADGAPVGSALAVGLPGPGRWPGHHPARRQPPSGAKTFGLVVGACFVALAVLSVIVSLRKRLRKKAVAPPGGGPVVIPGTVIPEPPPEPSAPPGLPPTRPPASAA